MTSFGGCKCTVEFLCIYKIQLSLIIIVVPFSLIAYLCTSTCNDFSSSFSKIDVNHSIIKKKSLPDLVSGDQILVIGRGLTKTEGIISISDYNMYSLFSCMS